MFRTMVFLHTLIATDEAKTESFPYIWMKSSDQTMELTYLSHNFCGFQYLLVSHSHSYLVVQ